MKDSKLKQLVKQNCKEDAIYIKCSQIHKSHFLNCIVDNLTDLSYSADCSQIIERLKFLTFLNQRVLYMFMENCQEDISKF